jgi:hypothetical protein
MPRKLRLQYPGAIYHVMNRGDRRERIFEDDEDRHRFLKTLSEACEKTGWQVHAYCLKNVNSCDLLFWLSCGDIPERCGPGFCRGASEVP